MKKPIISIITATYNSSMTIRDTIESIINQTYQNIEYIIIDGLSNDNTLTILKSYEKKFKTKNIRYEWISEKDTGVYNAWNKGLVKCLGEWIIFLGSDDYFKNDKVIENIVPFLEDALKNKQRFVYGIIEHINTKNELIERTGKPWHIQKKSFLKTMNLPHTGCFNHVSLFKDNGYFDESFKIAGDYEFLLREYKDTNKNALFVNMVIAIMREGGISANLKNRKILVCENYKARRLNKIDSFSIVLLFWYLRVRFIEFINFIFGDKIAAKTADFYRISVLKKNKRWS